MSSMIIDGAGKLGGWALELPGKAADRPGIGMVTIG
jgi:hypothetical protein